MTTHNNCPEQFTFPRAISTPADTFLLEQRVADMDMLANTFMRAPGESIGTFALETAIDELAEAMKLDPIDLRARLEPEKDPVSGKPFSSRHLREAYAAGGALRLGQAQSHAGIAARGRVADRHGCRDCDIPVLPDARRCGAHHAHPQRPCARGDGQPRHGHGHRHGSGSGRGGPLGLPAENIIFDYGDTALPRGTIAGGSSQTASIAAAVAAAAAKLVADLLKRAGNDSPLAGLSCRRGGDARWRARPS